jgi:mannosyltransferase OCH1-like enzyme
MLNHEDNFFERCQVETSLFDINLAELDLDWQLIKNIFYKNQNSKTSNPIPKVIHFIWLGSKLPEAYCEIIDDWKQKTGFDVEIWDDYKAKKFLLNRPSLAIFERSKSFGIKSDVLRYEILHSMGGLYVDTDFLCCSTDFAKLHESTSFYAGICLEKPVQINNGIMASVPNHHILKICIYNVDDTKYINEISCDQTRVLYQTGPWLLTAAILYHLKNKSTEDILIFPSKIFHPFPAAYRENQSLEFINQFIEPYSMACHLWHSSWQPKSKFFIGSSNV